jgi:hypothetical protein
MLFATRSPVPRGLVGIAEHELVQAHAGLSKLAMALEASRTMRVQTGFGCRCAGVASGQTAGLIRLTLGSSGHGTLPNQIKLGDRRQPTLTRAEMERVPEVL